MSGVLSIGVRAMAAAYAQMQTTSHNIANANVPGYSRQQANLATAQGQFTGVGFFGRGVDVVSVDRAHDAFLTREAASARSLAAMDVARRDQLMKLETVFQGGERGIGHSVTQFFSALSDLASRPSDASTRQVVLARAQDMAMRFNDAATQISMQQRDTTQAMAASVQAVNGLAASIAKVNGDIAAARGLGHQPNDLLDKRDQLISQLAEHVQVSTIPADDGTLGVFTGGGQRLVLGTQAEKLYLVPDTFDASRSVLAISEGDSKRTLTTDSLGGGGIVGLLNFQNNDIVAAQTALGQLSRAVAGAINEQQALGLNLLPPAGSLPSNPLFGFVESTKEKVLPASTNQRNGAGEFTSLVSIEVVDPSRLKAAEYELRADPLAPGTWQLVTVPATGAAPVTVADGDVVDGFRINFNSGPVAGERFLLQPVTHAAAGMQRVLTDPLGLAAASPFVASMPTGNTGSAAVSALRMVSAPTDPAASVTITFTGPDPGDPTRMLYDWEMRDGGGAVIGGATGATWTPGQPIPSPPNPSINGFEVDLSGVPAAGDTLAVNVTEYPTTNNGNALALNRLGTLSLVGRELMTDGSLSGGMSFNESFVSAMADFGVRTQSADTSAAISGARAAAAETARSDQAGVNLDEEAARLIQFQQSYQAAAKVLQVAQQIFADLLKIAG